MKLLALVASAALLLASTVCAQSCPAGELPVSVEGGSTGCAAVPICTGGFPSGNCPAGAACGVVKTGVYGCKLAGNGNGNPGNGNPGSGSGSNSTGNAGSVSQKAFPEVTLGKYLAEYISTRAQTSSGSLKTALQAFDDTNKFFVFVFPSDSALAAGADSLAKLTDAQEADLIAYWTTIDTPGSGKKLLEQDVTLKTQLGCPLDYKLSKSDTSASIAIGGASVVGIVELKNAVFFVVDKVLLPPANCKSDSTAVATDPTSTTPTTVSPSSSTPTASPSSSSAGDKAVRVTEVKKTLGVFLVEYMKNNFGDAGFKLDEKALTTLNAKDVYLVEIFFSRTAYDTEKEKLQKLTEKETERLMKYYTTVLQSATSVDKLAQTNTLDTLLGCKLSLSAKPVAGGYAITAGGVPVGSVFILENGLFLELDSVLYVPESCPQ